jgi:hypothetical protein
MSSVRLLYITHRRSRGGRQIGDLADRPRLDGTGAIVGELTHRKQESEGVFGRAPQVHCPKRKRISPPNHLICPRANIRLTTQASARGNTAQASARGPESEDPNQPVPTELRNEPTAATTKEVSDDPANENSTEALQPKGEVLATSKRDAADLPRTPPSTLVTDPLNRGVH